MKTVRSWFLLLFFASVPFWNPLPGLCMEPLPSAAQSGTFMERAEPSKVGDSQTSTATQGGDSERSSEPPVTSTESEDINGMTIRYAGAVGTRYSGPGKVSKNGTDWIALSWESGHLWSVALDDVDHQYFCLDGHVVAFTLELPAPSENASDSSVSESSHYRVATTNRSPTPSSGDRFDPSGSYHIDVIDLPLAPKAELEDLTRNIGEKKADRIRILWSNFVETTLEDATKAAAFQLAIWMIHYDNLQLSDDFHSGIPEQAKRLAENWLASISEADDTVQRSNLVVFSKPGFQDQIVEVREPQLGDLPANSEDTSYRGEDGSYLDGGFFGSLKRNGDTGTRGNDVDQQFMTGLFQQIGPAGSGGGGFSSSFPSGSMDVGFMSPGGRINPGGGGAGGGFGGGGGFRGGWGGSSFTPGPSHGNGDTENPVPWPPINWPPGFDDFPEFLFPGPEVPGGFPTAGPSPGPILVPEPSTAAIWFVMGLAMGYSWCYRRFRAPTAAAA